MDRDIIVVGASAGGVEALKAFVHHLPANLPAAIFVVLHVPPQSTSVLPRILARNGSLPAHHAKDGEPIQAGRIYVAPPNVHLLLHPTSVRLVRGPKENGHRPAVDALFRTAARSFGRRVIGIVLSGTLDDGAAGMVAIKEQGGLTIVQDPGDALFPGMPQSVLRQLQADHSLTASEISKFLDQLVRGIPAPAEVSPASEEMQSETKLAEFSLEAIEGEHPGNPSGFGCPDCGGALWEISAGEHIHYRCRVGHAWSIDNLMASQAEALEKALWVALRALEERATLSAQLAERLRKRGTHRVAGHYEDEVADCRHQAGVIREILLRPHPPSSESEADFPGDAEPGQRLEGDESTNRR